MYANKEDAQTYARQHYLDNKDKYLARSKVSNVEQKKKNKDWLIQYLREHPCVDCGETDIQVLEFDHIEMIGMRGRRIGSFIGSRKKLEAEVAKCEIRCANCHTRRTRQQLGWFR